MGLNRQMRRQQQRQKMREWAQDGTAERVRKLSVNGITVQDLDEQYKNGYEQGYKYASTSFFKVMYAAIAKELHEAGNSVEEIVNFLHQVDHRVAVMFDADEEIDEVFDLIGVRLNIYDNSIDRISEVVIDE